MEMKEIRCRKPSGLVPLIIFFFVLNASFENKKTILVNVQGTKQEVANLGTPYI